jgi:hypothetical protein
MVEIGGGGTGNDAGEEAGREVGGARRDVCGGVGRELGGGGNTGEED